VTAALAALAVSLLRLAWLLLRIPLVLAALVACMFAGQFLALFAWDRLFTHEEKRADRLVTAAEAGPANVVYLTPQIEADHRERRLLRLLERNS
jgi:hypothetical protein